MIYLVTVHDRQKRLSNIDTPRQLATNVWKSIFNLTSHKTVLYPLATFNAFDKKALPNRVNIVFCDYRRVQKIQSVLVNNNIKDIVDDFGGKSEDIYVLGSTRDIVERFAKDADYIVDYSTEELGHTSISIFDTINFADYTLLKKTDFKDFTLRYFVREKTNFIGF